MCLRDISPHKMDLSSQQHKCKCRRAGRNVRLETNISVVFVLFLTIFARIVTSVVTTDAPSALRTDSLAFIASRADALRSIIALLALWTWTSASHRIALRIV